MSNPTPSEPTSHLPIPVIEKLVANQEQQIAFQMHELELRKQTDINNFEFAKASLTIQANDREADRKYSQERQKRQYIFLAILFVAFLSFILLGLYMQKDQIVMEIVKAIVYIITGGSGGYAIGRLRKTEDTN